MCSIRDIKMPHSGFVLLHEGLVIIKEPFRMNYGKKLNKVEHWENRMLL